MTERACGIQVLFGKIVCLCYRNSRDSPKTVDLSWCEYLIFKISHESHITDYADSSYVTMSIMTFSNSEEHIWTEVWVTYSIQKAGDYAYLWLSHAILIHCSWVHRVLTFSKPYMLNANLSNYTLSFKYHVATSHWRFESHLLYSASTLMWLCMSYLRFWFSITEIRRGFVFWSSLLFHVGREN